MFNHHKERNPLSGFHYRQDIIDLNTSRHMICCKLRNAILGIPILSKYISDIRGKMRKVGLTIKT